MIFRIRARYIRPVVRTGWRRIESGSGWLTGCFLVGRIGSAFGREPPQRQTVHDAADKTAVSVRYSELTKPSL